MKQKIYLSHYIRLFLIQFLSNERGLSENTILAYRDALKLLLKYCTQYLKIKIDKLPCDRIDDRIVRKFLDYLEQHRGCTASTRNARLAALKTFFYYLGCEVPQCLDNSQRISAIVPKKTPHKMVDYLDPNELKAIMDSIDAASRNGIRDQALLLLMHNTGARVQEIVDIKLNDLRLDAASQIKLTGKGKKQRVCPLWEDTIEAVKAYISVRKPKQEDDNHLFLNDRGESITRFGIRYIIKKYTDKAIKEQPSLKQKKVSPHTFRHTTAMHLLQAGNELNVVRLWLGHASLNTTHMYVEINMEMKKEILSKTLPPKLKQEVKKWRRPKILEWLDELCEQVELCEV
jgi:site-specific recombinase XerD